MIVINLSEVRARMAADRRLTEDSITNLARLLIEEAIRQAERAFAVAGPIASADPQLSRIVHRGVLRCLRADVRKVFKDLPPDLADWGVEYAVEAYRGRLLALMTDRDAQRTCS